ncbi:nucleoside triphosphate pyrophosphatase [Teredinibacter sp. KSP-S5-2]|uniref:Maf family protein n=1 Tax=Teredinibacter sp. KSP-S5-2 TaxID=3034506 RepID=UPI0029348DB5|nr:nucleoside triphosphate pyrophosphatase [Teredinibacter sp. KSP-S5-2]WNO09576.1 Maf family protein [Teredinibacter sp. KSP-S5-2]
MSSYDLCLASQSPRRRELLTQIGVRYKVVQVDVEEIRQPAESPIEYVQRLARDKSHAGFQVGDGLPTLGADTIVEYRGKVLEKPENKSDFMAMFQLLSGQCHQVHTAICITHNNAAQVKVNSTDVYFRPIEQVEIEEYWQTGEPKDKAGGYGIQGLGGIFVDRIVGSYSSVVGLPITETAILLKEFNVPIWQHES